MPQPNADPLIGQPVQRIEGHDKVTGRAAYAGDAAVPGLVHAVLVQAPVARGTLRPIDRSRVEALPGVLAVFTHENLPPLLPPPEQFSESFPAERRAPLSDNVIHYAGQHVAIVVAETLEQAQEAAHQ